MDKKTVQPQLGKNVRTRLQKYLKKMYLNLGKVGFTADKDQSFTKIIPAVVLKTIDRQLDLQKLLSFDSYNFPGRISPDSTDPLSISKTILTSASNENSLANIPGVESRSYLPRTSIIDEL